MIADAEKNKYELKETVIGAFEKSSVLSVIFSAIKQTDDSNKFLLYVFLFSFIWCGLKYPFSNGDHYFFLCTLSGLILFWLINFKILKEDYYAVSDGVGQRGRDKNHEHRRRETFKKGLKDAKVGIESAALVLNSVNGDIKKIEINYQGGGNLTAYLVAFSCCFLGILLNKNDHFHMLISLLVLCLLLLLWVLWGDFRRYQHLIWLCELKSFLGDYMEDLSRQKS